VALQQFEVEGDVVAITKSACDSRVLSYLCVTVAATYAQFCDVTISRGVDALILGVFALLGSLL